MKDFVFTFGTNPKYPIHVEMVAQTTTKDMALEDLREAVAENQEEECEADASVEGGKLWIDVDLPNGCVVHVVLDLTKANECDECYEYDTEEKP
jgi:hypothetical protein